jgi:dihydrofolate synthase/folylpolyglutamate synthase
MQQWSKVPCRNKHIVIGFVKDKEVAEALQQFPKNAHYYFCQANIPRALPVDDLVQMAHAQQLMGNAYPTVAAAVQAAMGALEKEDALLISGSFFIVGEALPVVDAYQW